MWILVVSLIGISSAASVGNERFDFDRSFREFFHGNDYSGAQVGVNVDGRMAFLHGYGHDHDRQDIHSAKVLPISAASKAFTAISVLKLAEEGHIDLQSKVFGEGGILGFMQPWKENTVDPRLHDITVDHLLRHNGGWDYTKNTLYDPVLNIALLERHYKVRNISDEMDIPRPIHQEDIISYMMSQRLDFTPGTRSVVSNLGYLILGQIISEIADMPYDLYVKKKILEPCGLMHTKLGRPRVYKDEHGENDPVFQGYGEVLPVLVDSALGWESNAADLLRLFVCIDGSGDFQVLNKTSIRTLMARPPAVPVERSESWIGAGFHVNGHGAVWINGEYYTDDIVFYHKGPLLVESREELLRHHRGQARSWAVILHGQTHIPVRHDVKAIMTAVGTDWPPVDHYMDDVTDIETHARGIHRMVRFKVNEHHLTAYINAAKQLRYDIKWLNGFSFHNQTWFTVITEKVNRPVYDRLEIEHGLSEMQLYRRKLAQEKLGFNLTFFQNYQSSSRNNKRTFIAMFRNHAYNNHTRIKYGLEHFTQPYDKLLQLFVEEGYYPTSQSIIYNNNDGLVSFVLEKDLNSTKKKDFRSYDDITISKLSKTVKANARYRRKLVYLDASSYFGNPRFSAIFVKDTHRTMIFNAEVTEEEIRTLVRREEAHGFLPKIIDGYMTKNKDLKYAIYLEN